MSLNAVMGVLLLGAAAPQGLSVGILVVGVVALLIGLYLSWTANQDAKAYRDSRTELEQEIETLKAQAKTSSKPKPTAKKKAQDTTKKAEPNHAKVLETAQKELDQVQTDLKKLRQDHKQLREKNHNMSAELQDLRAKDKASREKKKETESESNAQQALVDLRFELAEAKQDVEQWKQRAQDLETQLDEAPSPAPEPEPVEEASTDEAPIALGDVMENEAVQAKLQSIEKQNRNKVDRLKKDHAEAEKDLRGKLKRTSLNAERQRRRADNNDRAYTITQRELDAARERIQYLEEQLHKANFAASTATNQLLAQTTQEESKNESATELDNSLRAALADTTTLQEVSAIDDAWLDMDIE